MGAERGTKVGKFSDGGLMVYERRGSYAEK